MEEKEIEESQHKHYKRIRIVIQAFLLLIILGLCIWAIVYLFPLFMRLQYDEIYRNEILAKLESFGSFSWVLRIQSSYELLRNGDTELIAHRYEKALFRKEGMHRYKDADGEFFARIICVEPEGKLILEDDAQKKRGYMFKEVEYIFK